MDYTSDPDGGAGGGSPTDPSNEHPNAHDFAQIEAIYAHVDGANTYSLVFDSTADTLLRPPTMDEIIYDAGQWGAPIRFNAEGRPTVFMLTGPNGADHELTHVFWAPINPFGDAPGKDRGHDQ